MVLSSPYVLPLPGVHLFLAVFSQNDFFQCLSSCPGFVHPAWPELQPSPSYLPACLPACMPSLLFFHLLPPPLLLLCPVLSDLAWAAVSTDSSPLQNGSSMASLQPLLPVSLLSRHFLPPLFPFPITLSFLSTLDPSPSSCLIWVWMLFIHLLISWCHKYGGGKG